MSLSFIIVVLASILTGISSIPQLLKIIKKKCRKCFSYDVYGINNWIGHVDLLWHFERRLDTDLFQYFLFSR